MGIRRRIESAVMSKETGRVLESGEACVFVEFLPSRKSIEFVIDTGFYGTLSLPESLASELNLQIENEVEIEVFGSQKLICGITTTEVFWLGEKRKIEILINYGEDVLLGTEMLRDCVLRINYRNKRLTIRKLK